MASDPLKPGDSVQWNTPQGTTSGTIKKKVTFETKISGHNVKASEDNPQFIVKSDKSGKEAAHKPDSLNKDS